MPFIIPEACQWTYEQLWRLFGQKPWSTGAEILPISSPVWARRLKFWSKWDSCEKVKQGKNRGSSQCDQIGRFFALWATIQSRWQQLFYPNPPHCKVIFIKLSKSFIFLLKSFLGNFYRHLAIFIWSHCLQVKFQLYDEDRYCDQCDQMSELKVAQFFIK